jgi:DtxR family Mn-dependent transcriptional regulator
MTEGPRHNEDERMEEYLEGLYKLQEAEGLCRTKRMSTELGVSQASVTEMLERLAAQGYIIYSPRRGAKLTQKGLREGRRVTRKHRLLEVFLHDKLGIDKRKVHREACRMEHSISDEIEGKLIVFLNSPTKCPDDNRSIPYERPSVKGKVVPR